MNNDQIIYLIGIVTTGTVFYSTGYWTGKNVWRKTGYEEGYLEALRKITLSNKINLKTKLRKKNTKGTA